MSTLFANPLTDLIEYEEMDQALTRRQGPVRMSGCLDSQKVHLIQEVTADIPWKLVVTYDESRAREIYDDFGCFRQDVWLYPARDLLFWKKRQAWWSPLWTALWITFFPWNSWQLPSSR